jgi:hypothetical protein
MKKTLITVLVLTIILLAALYYQRVYMDFRSDDTTDSNNSLLSDLIILDSPKPGDVITSPVVITGKARGTWYFEASFPVIITDWDGKIIAQVPAQAQGDWMTEDFVPFTATLTFEKPTLYPERGSLILHNDNPSGLPENDKAIEIPIRFE